MLYYEMATHREDVGPVVVDVAGGGRGNVVGALTWTPACSHATCSFTSRDEFVNPETVRLADGIVMVGHRYREGTYQNPMGVGNFVSPSVASFEGDSSLSGEGAGRGWNTLHEHDVIIHKHIHLSIFAPALVP